MTVRFKVLAAVLLGISVSWYVTWVIDMSKEQSSFRFNGFLRLLDLEDGGNTNIQSTINHKPNVTASHSFNT